MLRVRDQEDGDIDCLSGDRVAPDKAGFPTKGKELYRIELGRSFPSPPPDPLLFQSFLVKLRIQLSHE